MVILQSLRYFGKACVFDRILLSTQLENLCVFLHQLRERYAPYKANFVTAYHQCLQLLLYAKFSAEVFDCHISQFVSL